MKKILLSFISLLVLYPVLLAQQLTPAVIASDGGEARAGNLLLTWTLGEMAVESVNAGGRLYTQGFQQPLLLIKSVSPKKNTLAMQDLHLVVAPNPVQSVLNITVTGNRSDDNLHLTLTDILGRRVMQQTASGKAGSIPLNMSDLISGIYLLNVRDSEGQIINTFKIIKTQ